MRVAIILVLGAFVEVPLTEVSEPVLSRQRSTTVTSKLLRLRANDRVRVAPEIDADPAVLARFVSTIVNVLAARPAVVRFGAVDPSAGTQRATLKDRPKLDCFLLFVVPIALEAL